MLSSTYPHILLFRIIYKDATQQNAEQQHHMNMY